MGNFNVNTDLMRGDDIFLFITSADSVIAFATSCELQIDGEQISTQNKMSCRWVSNLAGQNSYSISSEALYVDKRVNSGATSFDKLFELMLEGDAVDWKMGPCSAWTGTCETNPFVIDSTAVIAKGKALITSLSLSAGSNEVATCSIQMTGSGEIELG